MNGHRIFTEKQDTYWIKPQSFQSNSISGYAECYILQMFIPQLKETKYIVWYAILELSDPGS
jgi:hypothetical protein